MTTKFFIVTPLTTYLSTYSLRCDNVTTKIEFFYRRREGEYSLYAFSATPPVSKVCVAICPLLHGFALWASPAVKHGAPPPEALLCVDVDAEEVQWVRVSTQAYIP